MPEPITAILLAGAAGGAAGKFIEKTVDAGERWLTNYFKDHQPNLEQKARDNSREFLAKLAIKVQKIEEENQANTAVINSALEEPNFGALLQKALIGSAQTESSDKHSLLAQLVANRLRAEPESLYAVASQVSCDAITHLTARQLNVLGLVTNLRFVTPVDLAKISFPSKESYISYCDSWMSQRLQYYADMTVSHFDLLHLEAMSCARFLSFSHVALDSVLKSKFTIEKDWRYEVEDFKKVDIGPRIDDLWNNQHLKSVDLTSIGQIIGVLVSDHITGSSTNIDIFKKA